MRACVSTVLATAVLLFLIPAAQPLADDFSAERLQKKYASISTMEADFTQLLVHKESGSREQRSGVLRFKKPLLVRWETQKPAPELLLVGADAIWNSFPEEEIAYKYALDLAQDSRSIIRVITGQARLDQDFFLEEEGVEKGLTTVRLYPKEPVQSMVEVLLWVDPKTDLIKKLRVYDFYGNENEISFAKQRIGVDMKDSLFRYAAPKNFLVEDRTKDPGAGPKKALLQ
jgi:outer membrane lipoprotein carrier protein